MHSLSTTPLITLPPFPLLNCKKILQVEFLNDTLVHIQLEVLNIETFKMFKTKFLNQKFQKRQLLKDQAKLYSKIFMIPIDYVKCYLKMSVSTQF